MKSKLDIIIDLLTQINDKLEPGPTKDAKPVKKLTKKQLFEQEVLATMARARAKGSLKAEKLLKQELDDIERYRKEV